MLQRPPSFDPQSYILIYSGNIRAKSSHIQTPPCESSDLSHRIGGDHGDAPFIEDERARSESPGR